MLYTAIAAVFFLIVCLFGGVLLGRINDIVEYLFFTDHLTGFANRIAFDNYLKSNDRKILDDGIVCMTFRVVNQAQLNETYGRDGGDGAIKFVAGLIKEAFGSLEAFCVYNGNAQFIVFTSRTDYITVEHIMKRLSLLLEHREKYTETAFEYEMGLAETSVNGIRKSAHCSLRLCPKRSSIRRKPFPKRRMIGQKPRRRPARQRSKRQAMHEYRK